jgi:hypothetical protein
MPLLKSIWLLLLALSFLLSKAQGRKIISHRTLDERSDDMNEDISDEISGITSDDVSFT